MIRVAFGLILSWMLLDAGDASAAGSVKRGEALAKANCSACHAIGSRGASPNPKSLPFRTLAELYPIESLQEALAEGISVGHDGVEMPEFQLSPAQIDDLTAYLKTVNRKGR